MNADGHNAEIDARCRCFQYPHDRGDRRAPCRHSLTAAEEATFRVVRRYTADTKEKRDWPFIADQQAVKIVLGLSSAGYVFPPAMPGADS